MGHSGGRGDGTQLHCGKMAALPWYLGSRAFAGLSRKYNGLGSRAKSASNLLSKMPLGKLLDISECPSPPPQNGIGSAS